MSIIRIFTLLLFLASSQATLAQEPLPDSFADADALAEYLESKIETYFFAIEATRTDAELLTTLETWNNAKLRTLEKRLQTELLDSLKVRLYPVGMEKVDYDNSPACGYACIEMVHSAYQKSPKAEALHYKTREANLTLVRAIYRGNDVVGTIVVHYPYLIIQQAVSRLSKDTGLYAEFRQANSGALNVLFSIGDSTIKQGPAQQILKMAGTSWFVATWTPGGVAIEHYEPPSLPWLHIALGLLVLIVGIALVIGRIKHLHSKRPPPSASGAKDFLDTMPAGSEGGETSSRTVVLGGGASDVDVSQYLNDDDITDLKNRLDD